MAAILQLGEAIGEFVRDGDTVALEGFTHLIPFAAGHEIIRRKLRGLTVIRMTPDVIYDQLIGAGCVAKIVFSWGGNPGVGSLHRLRDAIWPNSTSSCARCRSSKGPRSATAASPDAASSAPADRKSVV